MGIFVYAFTATGKSLLAKKYKNVIDMESTIYKYVSQNSEDESLKSTDKYDYILISDEICDDFLISNKYEYWWVYPNESLKEEYMQRCRKRGNNEEFIYWYSKLWKEWITKCKKDKNASKHIELNSNQYLEDVLPNLR